MNRQLSSAVPTDTVKLDVAGRGGRAVEGSCLENSQAMSFVGSNPTLSALENPHNHAKKQRQGDFRDGAHSGFVPKFVPKIRNSADNYDPATHRNNR